MAGKPPWKLYALISGLYEFLLATFLIFHIAVAFAVYELVKFIPITGSYTCSIRRQHHLYCSGHFPPFSPCRDCNNGGQKVSLGAGRHPSRISRGSIPGRAFSEDVSASKDAAESRNVGASSEARRSTSLSSLHRRKAPLLMKDCGPGCKGKCVASNEQLPDDFVEGSGEWLKQQKDRGNDEVILSLLQALQAERRNSRVLYEELEEERVAAETAANEAMAMILRLQEEKSALKLGAAHYQRWAEEKADHDQQAIQLLEEVLCMKESEWCALEEEFESLRRGPIAGKAVVMENEPIYAKSSEPLLLLKGVDETIDEENGDLEYPSGMSFQDSATLKRHSIGDGDSEGCIEAGPPTEDKPLKRFKTIVALENGDMEALDASEWPEEKVFNYSSNQKEKPQVIVEEECDDASSLLVQLCAVEKQLQALEQSESQSLPENYVKLPDFTANFLWKACDNVQPAESLGQGCSSGASETLEALANAKSSDPLKASENLEGVEVLKASTNLKAFETLKASADGKAGESTANNAGFSYILDDEKVVNIDVANINHNPFQEANACVKEDILEVDEVKRPKRKSVHWEACEVEKHLILPSNHQDPSNISIFTETCKLDSVRGLSADASPVQEIEEESTFKEKVTIEGINMRLQALENESTLLRQRSILSSHEHTSMLLLKEIIQELQELLKSNRSTAAANEALRQIDAPVKGGQLQKPHYTNGLGHFG